MKIKIFYSVFATDVEEEIGKWLKENRNIQIAHIAQSESSASLTISIFYTTV